MKSRITNYGRDEKVSQAPEAIDSARVKPEDFPVQYRVHKREDSNGKSKFVGKGLAVHKRPLKGE